MRSISLFAVLAMASTSASAASFFLSQGKFSPGQGQVSDYSGTRGVFEERFNKGGRSIGTCQQQRPNTVVINNLGFPDSELTTGAHPGFALPPGTNKASLDSGIVPADQSCYLTAPSTSTINIGTGSPVEIDIAPVAKVPTLYFGFYWGSIDPYNYIYLFSKTLDGSGNNIPIFVPGLSKSDGTILGSDILRLFGKQAGYNSYAGFRFTAAENFSYILEASQNNGFETDNYAFSFVDVAATPPANLLVPVGPAPLLRAAAVNTVPEPAVAGMMLLGLGSLCFARRRRG